jgi:hypothetical protein
MEAICSAETSIDCQWTIRRYIPEGSPLSNHRSENLKPYGRAIAEAVSRWLPTAAVRVRSRVWSSGICGGQIGCGTSFHSTKFSIFIITRGRLQSANQRPPCRVDPVGLHPPLSQEKLNLKPCHLHFHSTETQIVRSEIFTAVTTKKAVFWDVASCRYCVNRRFGGTYRLHLQARRKEKDETREGTSVSRCGAISQKTAFLEVQIVSVLISLWISHYKLISPCISLNIQRIKITGVRGSVVF